MHPALGVRSRSVTLADVGSPAGEIFSKIGGGCLDDFRMRQDQPNNNDDHAKRNLQSAGCGE